MNESTLNMLKNKARAAAAIVRSKVDVATEESKLAADYRDLGKKVYDAVLGDLLMHMKNDPSVIELIGSISERQKRIQALKPGNEIE